MSSDLSLFYAIHSLAGRFALLNMAIVFAGHYLIYGVIVGVLCFAAYAWHKGDRERFAGYLLAIAAALAARFVVASTIRLIYERERPFETLGVSHILVNDSVYSFPSGHTIFMFALATVIYTYNKTLGLCLAALGLLIGFARVAGGIHYPSDVLGGIVLGVLTGFCVLVLWSWLNRSQKLMNSYQDLTDSYK